jgi:hypothetical protein
MSTIKGQSIKTTTWTKVKEEYNYDEDDYNGGYEYGFEFEDNILEAQWFLTESDMYTFINKNELKVLRKVI